MKKLIIAFLFSLLVFNTSFGFQDFPIGMFFPGNSASNLNAMSSGGVNFVFAEEYNSPQNLNWYRNLIIYADANDVDVIANVRFESADYPTKDSSITYGSNSEFSQVKDNITELLNAQKDLLGDALIERKRVTGWYITDEPNKKGIPENELNRYADSLKSYLGSWGDNNSNYPHKTLHLSEGVSIENVLSPNPNNLFVRLDYSTYAAAFDVLHLFYYNYNINKDHTNLYNYTPGPFNYTTGPFPTGWYPGNPSPSVEEGTLRAFSLLKQKVNYDLSSFQNKEVRVVLVLGEEKPDYDVYQSQYLVSHGMTHAALKFVYKLGFDGISFYDWENGPEIRDDAVSNWTTANYNYKEAVSTELDDYDWLVTSFTNSSFNHNRTYISDRSNTSTRPEGQSPAAGYNENHSTVITNLAAGDLWGEEDSDYTYVINNSQNRKSIADGDDELVYTTSNGDFWISEEDHINSTFGDNLDSDQSSLYREYITAMTTGDFDGDGDNEVITAVFSWDYPYYTRVYSSNEGNNFKQTLIKEYTSTSPNGRTKITALASGDFKGNGRDELVIATYNDDYNDLYIYLADIATGENPTSSSNRVMSSTNSSMYVSHFAAGDFDGDFLDELATAFRNNSGSYSHLTVSRPKPGGGAGNPGWGPNKVWQSSTNYERVTGLAAGDFYNERKDYLITALWNSSSNTSEIYESSPSFNTSSGGSGDPTQGTSIYSGSYWHVSAMTTGSFRESLPSGASKSVNRDNIKNELPQEFSLDQNYPNPFNPTTQISYSLNQRNSVSLKVFDIQGRLIRTLVNETKSPGKYSVTFNASDLSSGIYFYRLESNGQIITKKLTLIK